MYNDILFVNISSAKEIEVKESLLKPCHKKAVLTLFNYNKVKNRITYKTCY